MATGDVAYGRDITLNGLTFSDADSTIQLQDGWGTGSPGDPFVVVEDILADDEAVLTIRGMDTWRAGAPAYLSSAQLALTKIVRNRTEHAWQIFELELRERRAEVSDFYDGLSFSQAQGDSRIYSSDRFTKAEQTDEPLDAVTFSGATILPGETVSVHVAVTDFSPRAEIFLIQRRLVPLAAYDGPYEEGPPFGGPSVDAAVTSPDRSSDHVSQRDDEGCSIVGASHLGS